MKIQEIGNIQGVERKTGPPAAREGVKGDGFSRILEEQMNPRSVTSSRSGTSGVTTEPLPGGPLQIWNAGLCRGEDQVVSCLETALEDLELVEERLRDGEVSPKWVDDAMSRLAEQMGDLQEKLQGLSDEHPLKHFGVELGALAYVEAVKWRRGDYI